jgi:glyoxylase-like metal-dependent hydrolase (beta-lactamase superfamily II)
MSHHSIYSILSGKTHVYLIKDGDSAMLVDAGPLRSSDMVTAAILKSGTDLRQLKGIIMTHTHKDHSESLLKFREVIGAPIMVHYSEAPCLEQGFTPIPLGTMLLTGFISWLGRTYGSNWPKYPPVKPDILVQERLDLQSYGFDGYIIHTPGHTEGSMSLILPEGSAFIGDSLMGVGLNTVMPAFANDLPALYKSWKILLDTGSEIFYPSHGGPVTRNQLVKEYQKRVKNEK